MNVQADRIVVETDAAHSEEAVAGLTREKKEEYSHVDHRVVADECKRFVDDVEQNSRQADAQTVGEPRREGGKGKCCR